MTIFDVNQMHKKIIQAMDNFKNTNLTHLALTQFHRWYQVYELPFNQARINNQLDILADDIEIITSNGTIKGKDLIPERLKVYEGWLNAHHVNKTVISQIDDKTLFLEADILYQNIRPDQSKFSYTIHYTTTLQLRDNDLPLFKTVNIQATGNVENPAFEEAYTINRAKSFMHYWLYCIESANGSAANFKELLADNFELNLSTNNGLIKTFEALEHWIKSISERVKIASHTPRNFVVSKIDDGNISIRVNFEWQGISVDNKKMIAETEHKWILENDPDKRFAQIREMTVKQIIPFQNV